PFCGFDRCSLDANGRIKLSPRVLADFERSGADMVLHCLPEGALAVYPEQTFLEIRGAEDHTPQRAGESFVARRTMRRFGSMSMNVTLSPQGRLTIPDHFRDYAGLDGKSGLVVICVEIGIEIWSAARWEEEQKRIQDHLQEKDRREMDADLNYKQD
ncbi:MAG: hypothetical protein IKB22_03710, partial [Lentisphaeria bacterium]|nr:hypothetical protein [Lentisphaeria bacterium]